MRQFIDMLPRDAADSIKSELLQLRRLFDDVHAQETDDGRQCYDMIHYFNMC